MATTTETPALSKDDIKALRIADEVHARRMDGQSRLEAVIRANRRNGSVFDNATEGKRTIPTVDYLRCYRESGICRTETSANVSAFAFSIGGKYNEEWQTVVSLLRPGDEVTLEWVAGNDSGYLRAAHGEYGSEGFRDTFHGLHHDILKLHVRRGDKRKYSFQVADSICPDNTARMIRGV